LKGRNGLQPGKHEGNTALMASRHSFNSMKLWLGFDLPVPSYSNSVALVRERTVNRFKIDENGLIVLEHTNDMDKFSGLEEPCKLATGCPSLYV
jgi:hypothetical protein